VARNDLLENRRHDLYGSKQASLIELSRSQHGFKFSFSLSQLIPMARFTSRVGRVRE
jgi:hypothetical protein